MSEQLQQSEKKYFWERMHEKNLKSTYKFAIMWIFAFIIIIIIVFYIATFITNCLPNNIVFIISGVITLFFGIFTIGSYWVARKVEEYVRMPIRIYDDFIKQAKDVLEKGRGEFKVMTYFPYYSLDKKVRLAGGEKVNELLLALSEENNKRLKILILNTEEQEKFFEKMRVGLHVDALTIEEGKVRCTMLHRNLSDDNFKLYNGERLPIQMFWSSTIVTFVAISEPPEFPTPELKCSGFTSKDPDINKAFRIIFDNYFQ